MIWSGFALALLIVFVLQAGAASLLGLTSLDLFLALALVCSMMAPSHEARLAAWFTGLAQDLGSSDPLGIHAFILGLTAVLLTQLREVGNLAVWWVRGAIAFLAACPGQLLYRAYLRYWAGYGDDSFFNLLIASITASALAAVLALAVTFLPYYSRRRQGFYGGY